MRAPRLRPDLDQIAGVGAAPRELAAEHRLARNENPYPPLPSVVRAIAEAAAAANRYPDIHATRLIAAIAERFGVPPAHVAVGTGAVGVCQQIVQVATAPGEEVMFAWPSFESFPDIARLCNARPLPVPLRREVHDLEAMADRIGARTRVVFCCNPNNPTGTVVDREQVARFLARVPRDVLVVFDEAYREFVRDPEVPDCVELQRRHPNVCALRTFSKAYGLAALRIGYLVGRPPVAEAVRKAAVPFGVSALGEAAALASLAAEEELQRRVDAIIAERERLWSALRRQGWAPPPSRANFIWLRLGERAAEVGAACRRAGIAVRVLPGEGCRVTVGDRAANDLILQVTGALAGAVLDRPDPVH